MDEMAESIPPLLDEAAADADVSKATTAIFYSISNTQPGLRGVVLRPKSQGSTLTSRSTLAGLCPICPFATDMPRLYCAPSLSQDGADV